MAANIKDTGVTPKKRGRPSKEEIAARNAREREAQGEIDAKEGVAAAAPKSNAKPPEEKSAPAFGHNRATEGLFLRHVQTLRAHDVKITESKLATKALVGQKKDLRNLAKADGIVLGELDQAIDELETERVDLLASQERLELYRQWLGLPTLATAASAKQEKNPAQRWNKLGNVAGRLGENRAIPDACPPEHGQDWLHGYDAGQLALMKESPLTRSAFDKDGNLKPSPGSAAAADPNPEGAPAVTAPEPESTMLVLKEEDFAPGTALADCNLATLEPSLKPKWEAATDVVVVIGGKKRVLKEEGYEDDGQPGTDLSEEEPADPALAAIAEAEPEIVDQVLADASGLTEEGEIPIEDDDVDHTEGELEAEVQAAEAADENPGEFA